MDTEQGAPVLGETFVALTTVDGDLVQLDGVGGADAADAPIVIAVRDADAENCNLARLEIREAQRLYEKLGEAIEWAKRRVGLDDEQRVQLYADEAKARRDRLDAERAAVAERRRAREQADFDARLARLREKSGAADQATRWDDRADIG